MGIIKKTLCIILIVILLQIIRFFVCDQVSCSINSQFVFGLIGNNALAIVVSLALLVLALSFVRGNLFTLLFVGAVLSNVVERFLFGGVKDYIAIGPWPAFNIADILIISAIIYLLVRTIFSSGFDNPAEKSSG